MTGRTRITDAVPSSTGRGMTTTRAILMGAGAIVAGVGLWTMVQSGLSNILAALKWLVGSVIVHDAILVPVTIVLTLVVSRLLPSWLRAPATVGLVVLGTVTVSAIPVLGRFGAIPDNPTLLDRNYLAGWLVLAALVAVAVAVAGWRRRSDLTETRQVGSRRAPI